MTGQTLSRLTLIVVTLAAIAGCRDEQKIKADQDALVHTALDNLVMVRGGSFQMGDFGPLMPRNTEKLPYNDHKDTPFTPSPCLTSASENTESPGGNLTAGSLFRAGIRTLFTRR